MTSSQMQRALSIKVQQCVLRGAIFARKALKPAKGLRCAGGASGAGDWGQIPRCNTLDAAMALVNRWNSQDMSEGARGGWRFMHA